MVTTGPVTASPNVNVMFKRGTQSSFNNLSTYQDGCFYLTTDSHRLYIGTGNNKADLVSQSVITYPNWASIEALSNKSSSNYAPGLCSEGQFYYAKAENILCTYSNGKWTQINPDHNDDHDTYVKKVSVAKNTVNTVKDKQLVYDVKITQAQKDLKSNTEDVPIGDIPTEVIGQLTISAADLDQIATHTNVGMEAEKGNSNQVYLKNSGTGANAAKKVELAGGGSVSVSTDSSNKITISGIDTTYSLNTTTNTTGAKINLQNQKGLPTGSFAVEVDGKALTVESNTPGENGFIKLAHAKPLTSSASYTPHAAKDAYGNVTLLMPTVSVNEYGHVTAVGAQNVTFKDKDTKVSAVTADTNGRITVTMITDEKMGIEEVVNSGQDLYHEITVDGTKKKVYNKGDLGAFYSSAEVDTLITNAKAEMNAMTYCGTITKSEFGQIKDPQKGDTYKAAESFTIGSVSVDTGDLIIYNGADVAAGLEGDTTKWEVVPSGDDIDTTYEMQLNDTTIKLINQVNNNIAGQVAVKGTNGISVTNSGGLNIGHTNTITAGSVAGEKSEDNRSFSIPTIQYDGYGHITKTGTTTIDFPIGKDTTYTFGSNAANKEVFLKNSNERVTGSLRFTSTDDSFAVSMTNAHTDQPVVDLKLATVRQNDSSATNVSYSPLSGGNSQKFTVAKANVDAYGRVTGFVNQDIILNTDQLTYNVSTNVDSNILSVESSLTRNNTITQSKFVKVKSDSLTFSKKAEDAEDTVSVDLVWGTF